jgi:uracil-DNA glycosylase
LRELGCSEIFLDELTAADALALAAGGVGRAGGPGEAAVGGSRLSLLTDQAKRCRKCRLATGRTQVVFGRGSGSAQLVVVGEAPGSEEDRVGQPFVGPAGKLLDLMLLAVGFDRDAVYICNVLKCRPPGNRDPRPDEVAECAPYLHAQLDTIEPRALLAVGRFAAQMLASSDMGLSGLRGRVHDYRGTPVVATYHPAYLLRSPGATRKAWQDLQLLRQVLDERS